MGRNQYHRNVDRRDYNEHDDRRRQGPNNNRNRGQKQVNFADGLYTAGIRKKKFNKNSETQKFLSAMFPEDEEFGRCYNSEQAGRGRPVYSRERGHRGSRSSWRARPGGPGRTPPGIILGNARLGASPFQWYKVTIKNGAKYEKMDLLRMLVNKSEVKFVPMCYTTLGNSSTFYIEEAKAVASLKELDDKIEMPDGFKLRITMDRTTPPNLPVTDTLVDKIKEVLAVRYRAEHFAIDLAEFHKDPKFAGEPFYAPLWRSNILSKVMTLITDNVPNLKAINLANNKIINLDMMLEFKDKLSSLEILYLANNRMQDLRSLEKFRGIKLKELSLKGNPVVEKLGASYTSSIRKIFPDLERLDDKELQKIIKFDDGEEKESLDVPKTVSQLIKHEAAGNLVKEFLKQYFLLYDSDSREPLISAYHENAMMSISGVGSFEGLRPYLEESRNFLRTKSDYKLHKKLHRGRLTVLSVLSGLPKSEHDLNSFSLDIPFTSEGLMMFVVTGMFRERGTKMTKPIHFNRCFMVVPQGSGFCIINETLFICNPRDANAAKAFPVGGLTPATAASAGLASPVVPPAPQLDMASKRSLAQALSDRTGMNLEYSGKCLDENAWDFDKAVTMFETVKNSGTIPPEAFIK